MAGKKNRRSFGFFLAELLILILGITGSFFLNELRIGQKERVKEKEMLVNFQKNLLIDSLRLSSSISVLEKQLEFAEKVLISPKGIYSDSLFIHTVSLLNYAPFSSNDLTYQQMESTGTSSVIQNEVLMNLLVGLYESGFETVVLWSNIDGDHVKNRVIPFVEDNFPFVKGLNYPSADASTKRQFVKAVQSEKFLHLIQFGQSYKASTLAVFREALDDVREVMELLEREIEIENK